MGWFNNGLLGLFGGDDDAGQQQPQPQQSWKANLTGIPDTDNRGQWNAISAGLASAAMAMADANRPGRNNGLGNLLAYGAGGLFSGLGAHAMQRQMTEARRVKRKMAEMQMQGMEREQSAFDRLPGMISAGGVDPAGYALPGEAGRRYMQYADDARKQEQWKQDMALRRASLGARTSPEQTPINQLRDNALEIMLTVPREQWTPEQQRVIGAANDFGLLKGAGEGGRGAPNKAQEDDDKKQLAEIREAITGAEPLVVQYDTALSLLDKGVQTGPFFEWRKRGGQALSALGVESKSLASMEALEATLETIRLNMAKYMKGAISDKEQEILRRAAGGTSLSPAGLREVLETARKIEMRNLQSANARRDYFEQHGTFAGYRSTHPSTSSDDGWEDF